MTDHDQLYDKNHPSDDNLIIIIIMTYMIMITDHYIPYDQNQPPDDNSLQLIIFVLFHQVGDHLVVVMIINGHNFSTSNEEIIVTIIIWSKLKIMELSTRRTNPPPLPRLEQF